MITINLLGKSPGQIELEWDVNEILSRIAGHDRWRWEFDVRRFERFPYCISGDGEEGELRFLFNEAEMILELTSEGETIEIEAERGPIKEVMVRFGGEEFNSRALVSAKADPLRPETLLGLIETAMRTSALPSRADAKAFRERLEAAVKFGKKKMKEVTRLFAPALKRVFPKAPKGMGIKTFQRALDVVDFELGRKKAGKKKASKAKSR